MHSEQPNAQQEPPWGVPASMSGTAARNGTAARVAAVEGHKTEDWLKPHWPEIEASIVRQAVTIERSADGNTRFVSPAGLKRGARGSKPVGTWVHLANLKLIH